MKKFLDLLQNIVDNGFDHSDRTGVGRRSIYGQQVRFNMRDGFPLVTTRYANFAIVVKELLWFLKGSSLTTELGAKIWDNWAVKETDIDAFLDTHLMDLLGNIPFDKEGSEWPGPTSPEATEMKDILKQQFIERGLNSIGNLYGKAWRKVKGYNPVNNTTDIDQIANLVEGLKTRPYSARHVVSAWVHDWIPDETVSPQFNVLMGKGALAPCHVLFQCFVTPAMGNETQPKLSLMMYQRSVDTAIGAVTNIAEYSLLLHMLAQVCDMEPYEFIWNTGDTHIYLNHLDGVKEQLSREPKSLPKLSLNPEVKDILVFKPEDIELHDYNPHGPIKFQIS